MAQAYRNGSQDRETFHKFFDCWLSEQNQHLEELVSASKDNQNQSRTESSSTRDDDAVLRSLVDRVIQHYEDYYRAKSRWAKQDVFSMLTPSWRSTLEVAFLWIGGWRPSMAFHLLYSKSGLQLEAQLVKLIQGLSTSDLADLSSSQLGQVDELQARTIREEKKITEKMAKQQEIVADSPMVELSHAVTESLRSSREASPSGEGGVLEEEENRVESVLASKEEGLEEIFEKADDLRLRTLRGVLNILTPIQAIHFLIAAAELHLRVHDWGVKKDARANHVNQQR